MEGKEGRMRQSIKGERVIASGGEQCKALKRGGEFIAMQGKKGLQKRKRHALKDLK